MIRRALLVLVMAGVALASSVSAALAWDPPDTYTVGNNTTETLTSTLAGSGATLTCITQFVADLRAGATNPGDVTSSTIRNCTTTAPNCTVSVVGDHMPPWDVAGTRTNPNGSGTVAIGGDPATADEIVFKATYSGAGCVVNGTGPNPCTFDVVGQANGNYDATNGQVSFPGTDALEVDNSNCQNVPDGTGVDLSGFVTVQGTPKPVLEP